MSAFRLYLWKEWREQRAALAALTLMLPVLVLTIGLSLPLRQVAGPTFVGVIGALALVMTVLAVGGELLATDRRRGAWIERLPRGLEGAFPAKLVLFALMSLLALLYGHGLGIGMALARSREHFLSSLDHDGGLFPMLAPSVMALALGLWTFASSAWCARSMLALAAGVLFAGALAFPLWAFDAHDYRPECWELVTAVTLFVGGALTSAWVGFTRGQRLGRSLGAVALRGGSTGALALAPLWGWTFVQLEARDHFDLNSPYCEVEQTWVSADGSVAVLEASMLRNDRWIHEQPSRTLWIDLTRGQMRDLGLEDPDFSSIYGGSSHSPQAPPDALNLRSYSDGQHYLDLYIDERNGQVLAEAPGEPDEGTTYITAAGHGWSFLDEDYEPFFHDPYTGLDVHSAELGLEWGGEVLIGPYGWLIHGAGWLEYDTTEGSLVPADWLAPALAPVTLLPDGRLLAVLRTAQLALIHPDTREFQAIGGFPEDWRLEPMRDELQGSDELYLTDGLGRYKLALECRELIPLDASHAGRLVRRLVDGDLVILTAEGFVRREADTGERQMIVRFTDLVESEVAP